MPFLKVNNEWFSVNDLMTALQTTYASNQETGNTIAVIQSLQTEASTKILGYKEKFRRYSEVIEKGLIFHVAIGATFVVSFIVMIASFA